MFDALQYPFVQNALYAGSFVALVAAVIGYFMIARGLTFAGHALPNIGFAGAAGAVLLGIDPVYGLFTFTLLAAAGISMLGREARERDISIGILMTFALGLGLAFLALYSGYAERVYSILFGTILGVSQQDVLVTAIASMLTIAIILALFRPLLFSTFDPLVAEARGVPVRLLGMLFLLLTAISVSLSIQVTGALLCLYPAGRACCDGGTYCTQSTVGYNKCDSARADLYMVRYLPGRTEWRMAGKLLYCNHCIRRLFASTPAITALDGTREPQSGDNRTHKSCSQTNKIWLSVGE